MSARVVSLRALVIEDAARTVDVSGLRSVARLLRRADLCDEDLAAVCGDLRHSGLRTARNAGVALAKLRTGAGPDAAVDVLAGFCGLERDAWIAATCDEQRVTVTNSAAA